MSAPAPGTRVRVLPHVDAWMRGVRYGTVIRVHTSGALDVAPDVCGARVRIPAHGYADV